MRAGDEKDDFPIYCKNCYETLRSCEGKYVDWVHEATNREFCEDIERLASPLFIGYKPYAARKKAEEKKKIST